MSSKCSVSWCDLSKYELNFGLDEALIEFYPALSIALCALSKILTNDFLLCNFSAHFIPFDQYNGLFPSNVSETMISQIKNIFVPPNAPFIKLQQDEQIVAPLSCAVYGSYLGRQNEADINTIYINKELLDCSRTSDHPTDIIKYGILILSTILHELGHWCFHHFACNMDHDLATPKGVLMEEAGDAIEFLMFGLRVQHYGPESPTFMIDKIVTKFNKAYRIIPLDYMKKLFETSTYTNVKDQFSIKISMKQLREAAILQDEVMKFNLKRVFNPMDEPALEPSTAGIFNQTGKRVFDPHDKDY